MKKVSAKFGDLCKHLCSEIKSAIMAIVDTFGICKPFFRLPYVTFVVITLYDCHPPIVKDKY